jgi:hypothetical protein
VALTRALLVGIALLIPASTAPSREIRDPPMGYWPTPPPPGYRCMWSQFPLSEVVASDVLRPHWSNGWTQLQRIQALEPWNQDPMIWILGCDPSPRDVFDPPRPQP